MKKTFTAHRLSQHEKIALIKQLDDGKSISEICRSNNISRTIFYKWLFIYNSFGLACNKNIFKYKYPSGKNHWRRIDSVKERKIIKVALNHPEYSIRLLSSITGVSTGKVWNVLKRRSLSKKQERRVYKLQNRNYIYKLILPSDKKAMISRYENGEAVISICRDFGVSRTSFYNWLKKYRVSNSFEILAESHRPKGASHWRHINGLELAVQNYAAGKPEYSLDKLHHLISAEKRIMTSRSGLYYVLKRLGLNTINKRKIYVLTVKNASSKISGVPAEIKPVESTSLSNLRIMLQEFLLISSGTFAICFGLFVFFLDAIVIKYRLDKQHPLLIESRKEDDITISGIEEIVDLVDSKGNIIYRVKAGDNLWFISEQIYDSGYNWVDIAGANKLYDPDLIYTDQKLKIPVITAKNKTINNSN